MYPSLFVLHPSRPEQQKVFVLRNLTNRRILVKIVSSCPDAFELDTSAVVVDSMKYVEVLLRFNETAYTPNKTTPVLNFYARPVTEMNFHALRAWVSTDDGRPSQVAFTLSALFKEGAFSAGRIVLDLPGNATMVEPVWQATKVCEAALSNLCGAEEDTNTAQVYDSHDFTPARHMHHRNVEKQSEHCSFMQSIMETVFPPVRTPVQ